MAVRRTLKTPAGELAAAIAAIQKSAVSQGLDKMTMREINALIAEVRREKDRGYSRQVVGEPSEKGVSKQPSPKKAKASKSIEGLKASRYK
jgi:hypothetical protein